jgi:hypothetical protein
MKCQKAHPVPRSMKPAFHIRLLAGSMNTSQKARLFERTSVAKVPSASQGLTNDDGTVIA